VPQTARVLIGKRAESGADRPEIGSGKQLLCVQHLRVGDRGLHVIAHQAFVEGVVLSRGVIQHTVVERGAFVPQSRHVRHPVVCTLCSAGVRAFTSATIIVPVPSLVKTSPRMPSGAL